MKKICVVITSRASYARVKSVLRAIKANKDLELFLVGSASLLLYKYGNAVEIIEKETGAEIVYDTDPVTLVEQAMACHARRVAAGTAYSGPRTQL